MAISQRKCYGYCNLEPSETRAPKASYTYEYYQLLKFINKIKIEKYTTVNEKLEINSRSLTKTEILKIAKLMKSKPVINFTDIRTELDLALDERFNLITYVSIFEYDEVINRLAEKKKQVKELENYHRIKKILSKQTGLFESLTIDNINTIAHILTVYKNDEIRIAKLENNNIKIPKHLLEELLQMSFREISDMSVKALNKLIPYLENGVNCRQSIKEVYKNEFHTTNLNRAIFSPISRRTLAQTIKVVKAIINKYGLPTEIIFRTSKELTQKRSIRDKNKKYDSQREIYNNKIKQELMTLDVPKPTTTDFIKYELWNQQNGICMYSGETISLNTLFTDQASIDYIIPFSKSCDESLDNKVVVLTQEKENKGNKTAYEYVIASNKEFEKYQTRINNMKTWKKKRNLLQSSINLENTEFEDLHFINIYLQNYLSSKLKNIKIKSINNSILHYVKHQQNLFNIPDSLKYSVNAIITALATKTDELDNITKFAVNQQSTDLALSEVDVSILYKNNKIEGNKRFVGSCKPRHKANGKTNDETLRSKQISEKNIIAYSKTELKKLKLDKMGEIEGYPDELKKSDKILYNVLKNRLKEYNGNASKAFEDKFYKPKLDGSEGNLVKKIKLEQKITIPVELKNNTIAINGDMIRIDVFKIENDGYYYIPIYVSDTVKKALPTKACVSRKSALEWKEMDDNDFLFSIYPKNLIYLESIKPIQLHSKYNKTSIENNKLLVYFNSADISGATIGITSTDNVFSAKGIGIKGLTQIKKYEVDVLGNYYEMKREDRRRRIHIKLF